MVSPVVTGHQGHAGLGHQAFGFGFEPHGLNGRRRRANENQTCVYAGLCKVFVFAQETVARVNRLCPRIFGGLDDALPTQIAVFGRVAANVHGFAAHLHVFSMGVGVRIHRHCFDGQPGAGRSHAAGDFSAVRDQYLIEHLRPFAFHRLRKLRLPCNLASLLHRFAVGRRGSRSVPY